MGYTKLDLVQDICSVCRQLRRAVFADRAQAIELMKEALKTLEVAIMLAKKAE